MEVATSEELAHWDRMKKILVATDGSLTATDAISFAIEFASHHQSELVFVHVVPTIEIVSPSRARRHRDRVAHEPTEHDHAVLRQASAVAVENGVTATTVLLGGSTADEIIAHAESCDGAVMDDGFSREVNHGCEPTLLTTPPSGGEPNAGVRRCDRWLNTEPLTPAALRGKVVAVDFWTYTCINWLRTLPYLRAWAETYGDTGWS